MSTLDTAVLMLTGMFLVGMIVLLLLAGGLAVSEILRTLYELRERDRRG